MCAGAVAVMAGAEAHAQTIRLDDFEAGSIRVVNAAETIPQGRYLWNQYESDPTEGPDPGVESVSSTAHDGASGLKVTVNRGNLYLQFYPYNGVWRKMSEFTQPSTTWRRDTFNRMRFWIKVPRSVNATPPGQANAYLGTYLRSSNGSPYSAEEGGGHGYHSFNIPYTGEWHQIIIDTHPSHWRGASGGVEPGNQEYPTRESGYNYFDAMTRFYVDFVGRLSSVPADFYLDGFELYRETRAENIAQIYTLNGVHIPSTNTIYVGWMRHKDQNAVRHEVRYAFQDVFQVGWQNATPAPFGMITPPGWQGYNGMEWSTNAIDLTNRSVIYIAIKPENSTSFRQIAIPLTGAGPTPSPEDTTPPTIDALVPSSGATGVSVETSITARFSEGLDPSSVTSSTFDLRGPQGLVPASIAYDAATLTATLDTSAPLAMSTTYTATVYGGSSGVKDVAGNPLASNRSWSFTTGADTTPPTVSGRSPAAGAMRVTIGANVVVRFDEAMAAVSINGATVALRSAAGVVPAVVSYDASTFTVTLNPSVDLLYLTVYTATVMGGSAGVKDASGNRLAASASWSFTTQPDTTPPVVVETIPEASATNVPVDSALKVRFSKPMNPASVNTLSFELRGPLGPVAATVSYDASTAVAGLRPTLPLLGSTTYVAAVKGNTGGVTDAAGNPLAANVVWSFTTSAVIPSDRSRSFSLFSGVTPSRVDPDRVPIEVGIKFHSEVNGHIVGIRFFKYPTNNGAHLGSLWTSNGTRLASALFTNETAYGWQEARFANPIPVKAGVTYVASYFTTAGQYGVTEYYFTRRGRAIGPLMVDPDGTRGGSTLYVYSSRSRFPTQTYRASNYFVDVVFVPAN